MSNLPRQLILHVNPSAIAMDFSPYMAVLPRHFLPNAHFQRCMFLRGTRVGSLTSLRPALDGCFSGKPVRDQLA